MARLLALVLLAGLGGWGCGGNSEATKISGPLIRGEGATFPAPLYSVWTAKYGALTGNRVIYTPRGSAKGIESLIKRRTDFAGSDAPLTDQEAGSAGDVAHVPIGAAAVAIIYNTKEVPDGLRFTPDVLADVFLGVIKSWKDPRIASLNPGVALPPKPITVIARSDGSGTTRVLTEYLSRVSPAWRERIGTGLFVPWPVGLLAEGNQGVSDFVWEAPGTISYCSLNFARAKHLGIAAIGTPAHGFVQATLDSTVAAVASAASTLPADLRVPLVSGTTPDSYPIVGFSYLLVRRDLDDPVKARALADFVWWGLHDGQAFAPRLQFAILPPAMRAAAVDQLRTIRIAGKPAFEEPADGAMASVGSFNALAAWFTGRQ
jgi:phosphate transport system substrate-binding protein